MDQPDVVANAAVRGGQLNSKTYFSLFLFAPENIWSCETSSVVPSRVSLLILHTQAEYSAHSRYSSRFPRRRPSRPSTAIIHYRGSVPSLSGRVIAYRWRSLPRVRRHRANHRSSITVTGLRPSFPKSTYGTAVDMCDTEMIGIECISLLVLNNAVL